MPSKPLEPGDPVRLGRFELLGRLGEGGQGVVYLGRGTNQGEERVAVKVLRSTVDANVLERLARELDAIHQVQPFVTAGVIEASAEGDRRYVVSEFIDGPSLQERVDDRGPLPEGDLQRLAVGTATALTAIHGAAWCTAISSRPTCSSARTVPGSSTSGSPGSPTRRRSPAGSSAPRPTWRPSSWPAPGRPAPSKTLREAAATVLTSDEPQTGGCVAGTVTFTHRGDSLAYRWTDNIEQNTATLHKG